VQIDSLQALAVTVAQVHSIDEVLKLVVEGLAEQPDIGLARIWLAAPGDEFVIAASAGTPLDKREDWSRLDGEFSRFRAGEKKVGEIGATGESVLLRISDRDNSWLARPEWAMKEKFVTFAGHPLVFKDEVLGVLAVFSRAQLGAQDFKWLRIFADSAAVAIANARAFEEINRLRRQLEQENDYLRAEVEAVGEFGDIVGRSPALQKVLRQVELVAQSDATVLVHGETGTGKELVARAIHERSPRRGRPLLRVNHGSVPPAAF
jgi:transcriptional regulator with GAF, ATPase, and Fis domain